MHYNTQLIKLFAHAAMKKNNKLLRSDIRYACGDAFYERGNSYFERNKVLDLTIKSEAALFVQFDAAVKGSLEKPYKQKIRILWQPDYSAAQINGECTCPIGHNCKHVAAACLRYQNPNQTQFIPKTISSCLDWLKTLDQSVVRPFNSNLDFIAYILKAGHEKNEFTVDFVITKKRKTEGLAKGKKVSLASLRFNVTSLSYTQGDDQEIIKLLTALNSSFKEEPLLTGATGYLALSRLLNTSRFFWEDIDREPLSKGTNRDLKLSWRTNIDGDYQLAVEIDPPAQLILTDPPYYFDVNLGVIGLINADNLSCDLLKNILTAPVVPIEYANEFSQRLVVEHPGIPLPAPEKVELIEADGLTPQPRLLLFGQQQLYDQYNHFMVVSFQYGEWTINKINQDEYSIAKTNHGLVRIKRNADFERSVIERLIELGFDPVPAIETGKAGFLLSSLTKKSMDSTARWRDFLQNKLPELERDGWVIEIEDSFLLNFKTAENWEANISESRNDWFEMSFNIEVDGQAMPLLPLIMPILENYDLENLPELFSIPLAEYDYLILPSVKIKPFLNILLELFNSSTLQDKEGTLKLSRFNAATLADLEEQNHGIFSINGGETLRELGQKLKDFTGIQDVAMPYNFNAELRPYQQQGLNWLQFLREYKFAGILADDMGLGKTIQTLVHLLLEKQQGRMRLPSLIIAPTSLMSNWRREAERFTPDLKVLILQGNERKQLFYKIRDYDLILTTYPLLSRDEETLLEQDYHYLILDEAQTIKNPLSKAAQLVRRIKSGHRLCLTGTPMENHLGELWAQFDFLMPGFLGDSGAFKKTYRTPIELQGNGEQRARLSRRVAPFMLRRTKQDVATELPAKTEIIRSVPLYEKQAVLYETIRLAMEKKVRDAIAQKGLSRSHITILDALLKLRQTCCDPRTLRLQEAQKVQESAKLDLLMELLPELLDEGRRILVFSQFTRMIALIESELDALKIAYTKLTGQTKNRDEVIERFKGGEVNVFLISLKAGGVGLNLTEADTVIIYDPWWNPAAESQAADRAHRIGQDKPVFIYKLITENTVEEKILAMQDKKRALAEGIYQGGAKEESLKLTAEDLTVLFEPM